MRNPKFTNLMPLNRAPEVEKMKTNLWHRSVGFSNELISHYYYPNSTDIVTHNYAGHHCYFIKKHIADTIYERWQSGIVCNLRILTTEQSLIGHLTTNSDKVKILPSRFFTLMWLLRSLELKFFPPLNGCSHIF